MSRIISRRHLWIFVLLTFLLSRLIIILGVSAAPILIHMNGNTVPLFGLPYLQYIKQAALAGDSGWYYSIFLSGYTSVPVFSTMRQENWTFFPLYPWLVRIASHVTGHPIIAGIILSDLLYLAFALTLAAWAEEIQSGLGMTSAALALLGPGTVYSIDFRAFSLFLLLQTLFLWALQKARFRVAVVFGALASLARPFGCLLVVPLAFQLVVRGKKEQYSKWKWVTHYSLLVPLAIGVLVVGVIDWHAAKNPLAFLLIQRAWGEHVTIPLQRALTWVFHPQLVSYFGWAFDPLDVASEVLGVALVFSAFRQRDWFAMSYLIPMVGLMISGSSLGGTFRWLAEMPVAYIYGARVLKTLGESWGLAASVAIGTLTMLVLVLYGLGVHSVMS